MEAHFFTFNSQGSERKQFEGCAKVVKVMRRRLAFWVLGALRERAQQYVPTGVLSNNEWDKRNEESQEYSLEKKKARKEWKVITLLSSVSNAGLSEL